LPQGRGQDQQCIGVLAGGGLVLTDLRAVLRGPDGKLQVATEIAVLTSQGAFPARIAAACSTRAWRCWSFPRLPGSSKDRRLRRIIGRRDQLLAIRASKQGSSLLFEVIGSPSSRPRRTSWCWRAAPGVPITFAGAPVFDAGGALAGLLVGPTGQDIFSFPRPLLQILTDVHHPPATQVDEHI